MSLKTLKNYFTKHSKMALWSLIFIGIFSLSYASGFAAGESEISAEDMKKVTSILNGFIMGAAALMGMVTSFITIFLYPGWINGTWFGLDLYLKEIWVLISNIVYFIFAFILIAIAFMNIIGKGDGNWELKQAMPKFIIGILIVPFSWFFVQFVLSISSVLTVGVLTLPYESFQGESLYSEALEKQEWASEEICKDVVISFSGDFEGQDVQSISSTENGLDENIKCKKGSKLSIKELLTGIDSNGNVSSKSGGLQNSIFGVISIYSYGILRIHDLDTITGKDLESIKTIADLIFKIVFDLLFIAVYLLLMIALMLALFVRGVRLWIYAMLSPTFGLLYFFEAKEGVKGENGKFSIMEFISLALVPVYVSAALAFGLTFILLASTGIQNQSDNVDTLEAGGFSLTLVGAHGSGESEESVIGKLIVEIFGVVILWIAVMFALKQSETTQNIVKPIADFGNQVGKMAMKAPTYTPIIPTPYGGISAASLPTISNAFDTAMADSARDDAKKFTDGVNPGANNGNIPTDVRNSIGSLKDGLRDGLRKEDMDKLNKTLAGIGTVEAARQDKELQEVLKKIASELGISSKVDNSFGSNAEFSKALMEVHNASISKGPDWNGVFGSRDSVSGTDALGKMNDLVGSGRSASGGSSSDTPINNNTTVNVNIGGKDFSTADAAAKAYRDHPTYKNNRSAIEVDLYKQRENNKSITIDFIKDILDAYDKATDTTKSSDN